MTGQFLPPEALSPDGYIIDQGRMRGVRYGRFGSDYNGCGWIAAYNLLRRCGKELSPEQTWDALGKKLRLGGRFGTLPLALRKFLRRYLPVSLKLCGKRRFARLAASPGILLYWTGRSAHNVCFSPCEHDGRILLCNAEYGRCGHCAMPEEFWERYVRFPFALIFTVSADGRPT